MRILLAEDDHDLGFAMKQGLQNYGHVIDWVQDGEQALKTLFPPYQNHQVSEIFDIILLDIGLPKLSGLQVLHAIRKKNMIAPVLIVTAKDTPTDQVIGLDKGADSYLTKPFDLDVVCATIRALQRRSKERATPKITYKGIVLDPASHIVQFEGEKSIISRREFSLLQKLLENPGRVISRDQLNQALYGWGENIDSNALEVHIHNLRKRFGVKLIRTIRGIGYMVEKEVE